jgi:hypothetical protein
MEACPKILEKACFNVVARPLIGLWCGLNNPRRPSCFLGREKQKSAPTSHPSFTPSTPLLPAPTLSAGERKVSGGE